MPPGCRRWGIRVYPRMRGGTYEHRPEVSEFEGLSPHARGHRPGRQRMRRWPGSIPACAGAPPALRAASGCSWVYPRMRGGTSDQVFQGFSGRGLSPHARGHHLASALERLQRGSIPACAGAPRAASSRACSIRVYPRMRGGTLSPKMRELSLKGLSPHARGHRARGPGTVVCCGSIPACAGAPGSLSEKTPLQGVYPRMRGGTVVFLERGSDLEGLSPHARGHRSGAWSIPHTLGSIPACAGAPPGLGGRRRCPGVYPRMRGGTVSALRRRCAGGGLSPHARGHLDRHAFVGHQVGSIPACAGAPAIPCISSCRSRVYPRMRGGTGEVGSWPHPAVGLSPHARGHLAQRELVVALHGSIPACAGAPSSMASI